MLQITLLVASLALADAVNPVTVTVGLYLASSDRPHTRVLAFAAGVFAVYGLGGAALLLGPGQLLATAVSSSDTRAFHTVSVIGGAALVIIALVVMRRGRSAGLTAKVTALRPRSALALGATVTLIDLPTAFPYFAAIAAVANAGGNVGAQVALLGLFNLIYVSPLLLIAVLPAIAGPRWLSIVGRTRSALDRIAPRLVAALTVVMGGALILRGADGLLA